MYVLVFWVEEHKYNIVTEDFVTDNKMLLDHQLVGLVKYGDAIGKKKQNLASEPTQQKLLLF